MARLLQWFRDHPTYEVNAWTVSRAFQSSPVASRQALSRLTRHPEYGREIIRPRRGFYQHVSGKVRLDFPDPGVLFHAIEGVATLSQSLRGGVRRTRQLVTALFPSPANRRNPRNRSLCYYGDWEGRPLTVQVTTRNKLQLSLRASTAPLDLLEFHAYLKWIPNTFQVPPALWSFHFDINRDHRGRLKVGPFRWQEAVGFVQVYWKESIGKTRIEAHAAEQLSLLTLEHNVSAVIRSLLTLSKEAK